jgi:hypothetical protein
MSLAMTNKCIALVGDLAKLYKEITNGLKEKINVTNAMQHEIKVSGRLPWHSFLYHSFHENFSLHHHLLNAPLLAGMAS